MIFTRSILNQVLPIEEISGEEICKVLNKIGLEVESFQKNIAPKKVVVGKILECQKHPDATKLNVCQVAIGGKEGEYQTRQIVCGAPNARADIYVAVALEGAELPQVKIQKAVLRGVESCGMLCSTTELGFPKVNDGIVELDASIGELIIGKELREYSYFNEEVYEISITPNRGDCMSLLGVARDLSAAFKLECKALCPMPKISENAPGIGRVLQVIASDKHRTSLLFKVIEAKPFLLPLGAVLFLAYNDALTEDWLGNALHFSMLFSGVLLNAYPQDSRQLTNKNGKVVLNLKQDEQGFESIYQEDKKLSVIGINGYAENLSRKVNLNEEGREFIILEASYIPPEVIAQKAMESKPKVDERIFTFSSRGSNTDLNLGLSVLSNLLLNGDAVLYNDTQEVLEVQSKAPITVEIPLLSRVIGVELDKLQVVNILRALEFKVEISSDENLIIATPPAFRHDVVGFQDIAEEIIRFYGIDNIPSQPLSFIQQEQTNDALRLYRFRRNLSKKAVSVGFNEVVHFVFENKEKLQAYGFSVLENSLELLNPITQDLNTLRSTLLLGLLRAAEQNRNNGFAAISLSEVGAVYDKWRNQSDKMAFLQSGFLSEERYPNAKGIKGDYFEFCDRIARVIGEFSLEACKSEIGLFHLGQCARILQNGKEIGILATSHPQVALELGLDSTYLCEISLESLKNTLPQVKMYSKFQKTQRDLSVVLDKGIPYFKLRMAIDKLNIPHLVGFYPLDIYQDDKLGDKLSLTIRFELQSEIKTLEEKDITEAICQVLEMLKTEFNVELR
ncbi:MAG: phenylalanine--tRNA ligase subunit beta [Helicobacter sp.]|nr:phenylalanine--tRNA ligase subunit beta [Helicobacter sp.]